MQQKRKLLWLICPLMLALILASVTIWVIAENTAPTAPSVSIDKFNLSFKDTVYLKYAVKLTGADAEKLGEDNFRMLFWTAPNETYEKGSESSSASVLGYQTISGERYYTFAYTALTAKQMGDTVYSRMYVNVDGNVYYSEVEKYSVLQYAYDVKNSATSTQKLKNLMSQMLSYGAVAQDYFEYNTTCPVNGTFLQIEVTNGTLEDGFTKGLYLQNTTVTVTAPESNEAGEAFSHWVNSAGATVSSDRTATLPVGEASEIYTAVYAPSFTPYEYFTFTELSDGTYSIKAKDINNMPADVILPSTYNGKAVTEINGSGFYNCKSLMSITIPNGVTSIGSRAFYYCTALKLITIPSSVVNIGGYAFYQCSNLENLTIPSSVTNIGEAAFSYCTALTSIAIPMGVTSIEPLVFNNCDSLMIITIPSSVTSIGNSAFSSCGSLASITIPSSVTSIGSSAFAYCTALTNITIPSSVTSISDRTFDNCVSLVNITIPSSVISIGQYAFAYCRSLENILFDKNSQLTSIGLSAFEHCNSLINITIPSSVTSIGGAVFYQCKILENVIFGENSHLTSIGGSAFFECKNLTSITIPNNLTSIGNAAFYNCYKLINVYYMGTAEEWSNFKIASNHYYLINATTIYYYSETAPTTEGNYWRYVNGVPTVWESVQA